MARYNFIDILFSSIKMTIKKVLDFMNIRLRLPEFLSLIIITLGSFLVAVFLEYPLALGFLPGLTMLVTLVWRKGVPFGKIFSLAKSGVYKPKEVYWLLLFIAIMLPVWQLSRTVSHIVILTLQWINMDTFFLFVFVSALLISMLLGTSLGSLSVIGVPVMGISHMAGLPAEWVAGALISGAFVGDRTSPFSSSFQLLRQTLQLSSHSLFKVLLPTTVAGIFLSGLFYAGVDLYLDTPPVSLPSMPDDAPFDIFIYFLPPVLMLLCISIFRNLRYAFIVSIITAAFISLWQGVSLLDLLRAVWDGVEGLGGIKGTIMTVVFIALAGIYSEIMERCNIIQPFIRSFTSNSHSLRMNTFRSLCLALLICIISPNQAFPIMLTGRVLQSHWDTHFSVGGLSKIMGNSTLVVVGLIPWNMLAILCSHIIHVPVASYLPFSVFLWILPFLTLITADFRHYDKKIQVNE